MTTHDMPMPALRAPGEAGQTLTAGQIGCVLNDIARTAEQIDTLAVRLQSAIGGDDTAILDTLAGAMMALAQRIGWAADMAADRIPGSCGAVFGDASQWMMPPSFHWDDEGKPDAGGAHG